MKVIDDFLPQHMYEEFRNAIMDYHFPWFFVPSTAIHTDKGSHIDSSFSHLIYEGGVNHSHMANQSRDIFLFLANKLEIKYNYVERARLGMIMPTKEKIVHDPHVDYGFKHYVALLYFTDEDEGETIFYDKVWNPDDRGKVSIFMEQEREDFEVIDTCLPKQNRLALFDGLRYHSSSTPRNKRRIAMNINFTVMENIL